MNMNEESGEGSARRIQVRFVTKLKAPFIVPSTAIAIPVDLTRFGLSSLVNALIQSNGNFNFWSHFQMPPCFFFCVNSRLLMKFLVGWFCRCWLSAWAFWFFDRWRVRADVARAVSTRQGNLGGNTFQTITNPVLLISTIVWSSVWQKVCMTESENAHWFYVCKRMRFFPNRNWRCPLMFVSLW